MDLGNLAARFAPTDNPLRFRQGSIVSVEADQCTLTVTIAGSTVPISGVRYATGVMPVPGLAVWLATDGRDLWAIATLMTTDTTPWGYYVDYTFARGATQPATPTGNIPASPPWYGSPPAGTTALWMSEATKNPQGVVVGSWSLPVPLTGDPGPAGTPAPLEQIEYSQDGTNWYTTPTGADVYIRFSNDGGVTWGDAVRVLGPEGPPAHPVIFEYSEDAASWHTTPTVNDNFLRSSSDDGATWSDAFLTTGAPGTNGTNGNYIAVAYKEGARTGISAPTGNGPVPSGWSGTPVALSDGVTNCLWVSRAICAANNTLIGSWSTPNAFIMTADYVKALVALSSPVISSGKTSYTDTATGFWMGLASSVYKFAIGTATSYMRWTGSALELVGAAITGPAIAGGTIVGGTVTGGTIIAGDSALGNYCKLSQRIPGGLDDMPTGVLDFYYEGGLIGSVYGGLDGLTFLGAGGVSPTFAGDLQIAGQLIAGDVTVANLYPLVGIVGLASGKVTVTGIVQNVEKSVTVTFPGGSFTTAPSVVCNPETSAPVAVSVSARAISATGFTLTIRRSDMTTTCPVDWIATSL